METMLGVAFLAASVAAFVLARSYFLEADRRMRPASEGFAVAVSLLIVAMAGFGGAFFIDALASGALQIGMAQIAAALSVVAFAALGVSVFAMFRRPTRAHA